MNRIIGFLVMALAIAALADPAATQPARVMPRVGVLLTGSPTAYEPYLRSLRAGLRDLGYVEGRTIIIEARFAMGKRARIAGLAKELVQLNSDVIVVTGAGAARVTRKASPAIPIVVALASDLVGAGVVASLAQPGGNTTGMTGLSAELSEKV